MTHGNACLTTIPASRRPTTPSEPCVRSQFAAPPSTYEPLPSLRDAFPAPYTTAPARPPARCDTASDRRNAVLSP
ncbi:MAG: hypothetical protein RL199_2393 [Pseudomonadota bacterium]|jgi:hypothetical protein